MAHKLRLSAILTLLLLFPWTNLMAYYPDKATMDSINSKMSQINQLFETDEQVPYARFESIQNDLLVIMKTMEHDYAYAIIMGFLSNCNYKLSKYNEALCFANKTKELFEEIKETNNTYYLQSIRIIAFSYDRLGNYEDALMSHQELIDICKNIFGVENPNYASSLNDLADFLYATGKYKEAIRIGAETMRLQERVLGKNHHDYKNSVNKLALFYFKYGDFNEAIKICTEFLKEEKQCIDTHPQEYAKALTNLASLYLAINNNDEAIKLLSEARSLYFHAYGTDHPDYVFSLNSLAFCNSMSDNHSEAIKLASDAIKILKRMPESKLSDYQMSLTVLSFCYSRIGNYNEAIKYGIEAKEIQRKIHNEKHPEYARSLITLAALYHIQRNYSEAIKLSNEALDIFKATLHPNHPDYANPLYILALSYSAIGHNDDAFICSKSFLDIKLNYILEQFNFLPAVEREKLWREIFDNIIQDYPRIVIKSKNEEAIGDLYDKSALLSKGLLLNAEIELSKLITESEDSTIIKDFHELQYLKMRLNKLYSMSNNEEITMIDSLEQKAIKLEQQLIKNSTIYGEYTRTLSASWHDIQKKLGKDDIVIDFLHFYDPDIEDYCYIALIIKENSVWPKLIRLFSLSEFSDSSSHWGNLIWGPLIDEFAGIKNIYFSPIGILHQIAIEYLPLEDGRIVSDTFNIFRLSSTRQLLIGRANSVFKNAIIYGGLDYDATSEQLIAANKKLSIATSHILKSNTMALRSMDGISISTKYDALEGSKREAEFISKHLRNNGFASVVYDKSRGTEESFKAMSGNGPSLLHIATHGFYWTEDEAELEKRKSDILRLLILNDNKLSIEDKAMTRSGLTMAGCNRAFDNNETMLENLDDGFLTAKEISLLDLRGLDLVVLSGCETAQGDISVNEGIFGLQRAFKKAGAQTIMMSLWDVNDTATEQMMKFFYTHLVAGESIHQSFIAAQQELRAIYPDPSHWAAFILLDALE